MLKLTVQEKQEILYYLESIKPRKLDLSSVARKRLPGRSNNAVKVVDIFGNDSMTVIEVTV